MALNSRPSLDPRWVWHNRNVASSFMVCDVEIYHNNLSARTYNATTNSWDSVADPIWEGKARIQPVNNPVARAASFNDAVIQQVQVQIELTDVDIRPGDYLSITESPVNGQLANFVYIVKSVLNSSNAWQRTLICDVDMESDPNA